MDAFAEVCESVARHGSRIRKVALVAEYLAPLNDEDLVRAVHFFCCGPRISAEPERNLFGEEAPRKISIGYATLRDAYLAVTGWDDWIAGLCHREVGDTGETISLLLPGHTRELPLSLEAAEQIYTELYTARYAARKVEILKRTLSSYRPLAIKYFIKVITGDLRIGLQAKMVEEAVAAATGSPLEAVRAANNRSGDLPQVALAARRGELHTIEARLFHPLDFMLAKPLEVLPDLPGAENYWIEHKYDGIRAQIHIAEGRAAIFTRGTGDATAAFPELEQAFLRIEGSTVLDGEIMAWSDDRALPFNVLQQRIARKKVASDLMRQIPVVFMAYDILYRNGQLLLDRPLEYRRGVLEQILHGHHTPLLISPQYTAASLEDVEQLFEAARASTNEGLVLKRRGSVYESGKRSGTWLKVKRPYATLDVVITAAEQGHGKRATMLSDYTFAVRSGSGFLNVGKAYSGLTDSEIRELTRLLRASATERFGHVLLVQPEIVLEVAFDTVQKSSRHKSGYALRFPRIVRWRRDKRPQDADDLQTVEALYARSVAGGFQPKAEAP